MGGVDLYDQTVNNYRICIRGKKVVVAPIHPDDQHDRSQRMEDLSTYWRFVAGLAVIHPHNSKALPAAWCTQQKHQKVSSIHCACYIALDPHGHFHKKLEKQLRCTARHKRSKWCCEKCNVTLCIKHGRFNDFHAPR